MVQAIVFLPLIGALIAGLLGRVIGHRVSEYLTTGLLLIAAVLSWVVFAGFWLAPETIGGEAHAEVLKVEVMRWIQVGDLDLRWILRVDTLTAIMLVVVTTVSSLVHLYSIGYMAEDPHRARFFAYLSLFTFAMLMLVTADNFVQLFFGWEGVGLASYLLIGFWYTRPSANAAAIKAFVVNRVGDFGFALGIFAAFMVLGHLDFDSAFQAVPEHAEDTMRFLSWDVHAMTVVCLLLFMGAMGKSAQFLLHTWLPDAMEGPTPVSALIHAATMVTAGVFMVARLSPLFEASEFAMLVVLAIGAITAFFAATVGLVQNDIKRVIAYSTCSQLGYMFVALGAGVYSAGIFHLFTHAFFKALLFLGAGSVIHAMHHEQDIRKMGGLRRYMPITYWTALVGSLALIGFPGTAGFFSKDALIEAVRESHWQGQGPIYWIAYLSVLLGVFVTALYTFRMLFLVFHGEERMDKKTRSHLHESPAVVTVPLILLAIPSAIIGWLTIEPVLFGGFFGESIFVLDRHDVLAHMGEAYHGSLQFILHALQGPVVWLSLAGVAVAWFMYLKRPGLPALVRERLSGLYNLLDRKYYFDDLFIKGFAAGGRRPGR